VTDQLSHRNATPEDLPFVLNSWVESYGVGSPMTVHIPKSIFYPAQRMMIMRLMRDLHDLRIACLADDPAVIVGFIMARHRNVLDYIYVKEHFRRMGVARAMVADLGIDMNDCLCTHHTYKSIMLAPKWRGLQYNPYLLFGEIE